MFFFFNDTATTEIYTLSLHDALPICLSTSHLSALRLKYAHHRRIMARRFPSGRRKTRKGGRRNIRPLKSKPVRRKFVARSEEHTSELQSRQYLVCRLLLEKKKTTTI